MIDPDLPYLQTVRQEKEYIYRYHFIDGGEIVRFWWRSSDDHCYYREYVRKVSRRGISGKLTPTKRQPIDVDLDEFQACISALVDAGALTFAPREEDKGIPHDCEIKVESGSYNSFPSRYAARDETFRKILYVLPIA